MLPTLATTLALFVLAALAGRSPASVDHLRIGTLEASGRLTGEVRARTLRGLAAVALHFEANRGQAERPFDYIASGAGYRVGLVDGGATLVLTDTANGTPAVLRLALRGARPDRVAEALDTLPGTVSYYRGADPGAWHGGVSTHARVRYAGVYDGIDVVYYGNQRRLQYDFHVAPGADPARIAFDIEGAEAVALGDEGQLVIRAAGRTLEQQRPFTYQMVDGRQREVASRFVLDAGTVRFAVGDYDRALPLVIDPVIAYSSWFGGSGEDGVLDVVTTQDGGYVLYGFSMDAQGALQFPTTPGAVKATRGGDSDAFVAKFNSSHQLLYSTLIGGSDHENSEAFNYVGGIAVGPGGVVHLTGSTKSADFPTTQGAHDTDYNDDDPGALGTADAFYVRLSYTGQLEYGTYLGGRYTDLPFGITVDAANSAFIVGRTNSSESTTSPGTGFFPIVGASYDGTLGGSTDLFVARFSSAGALTYSTYLGGSGFEAAYAADIRASRGQPNLVFIVSDTSDGSFPLVGGVHGHAGGTDGVVVRMHTGVAAANQLQWSTFFGGTSTDWLTSVDVGLNDEVFVAGATTSTSASFPAAPTWAGSSPASGTDVVVARFDTVPFTAGGLVYGMRLNGKSTDEARDIAVDHANRAWIAVNSNSFYDPVATEFPLVNNLDPVRPANGVRQALVQINASGDDVLLSTFVGSRNGRGDTIGVAINAAGDAIVAGGSNSSLLLVNPYQGTYGGGDSDAYVQMLSPQADLSLTKAASPALPAVVLPGQTITYTLTVTNLSVDGAQGVTLTDALPGTLTYVSCSATGGGVCGGSGNDREVSWASVAGGASVTATIMTRVNDNVGPGAAWTNTASVNGATHDPNIANNEAGAGSSVPMLTDTAGDADGDGLPNGWEQQYGLNPLSNSPDNGPAGDPDGDGRTNLQELAEGTHPRGFVITYLAEGATGAFFDTRLAVANPTSTQALVLTRFQRGDGTTVRDYRVVPAMGRTTIDVEAVAGLETAEFSTLIEADVQVVADRTMTWDQNGYGSHAERGILTRTATKWYFAEGATFGNFNLFYLIQNPNDQTAQVEVTYLLPPPAAPLVKTYTVGPQSRFNIWVDNEGLTDTTLAALANAELSAIIESTNGVPIIAERAMYLDQPGRALGAGHESAGVTAPSTQWFLAEGATGSYFDLFILIANPDATAASVQAEYLLDSGQVITKHYGVAGNSRFNIWVDLEDAALANAALSTRITSTNGVPIIVERAMWWPGPTSESWQEAHNSPGEVTTGTRWALAEGEVGGARETETYVLIANTSAFAGTARVTVLFEDGTAPVTRDFALPASSRSNVAPAADFPETAGKRFGMLVESIGGTPAQIVVERAMYSNAQGVRWAAGTNALATKLQ